MVSVNIIRIYSWLLIGLCYNIRHNNIRTINKHKEFNYFLFTLLYCYDAYRLLHVIQNEVNAKDCYSELEIKNVFYVLKPNIILLFRFDVYLPAFHN